MLALLNNGTVVSWGYGGLGDLGNGTTGGSNGYVSYPVQVLDPAGTGALTNVVAVASGFVNSYALLANGEVLAWGRGTFGGLGNGSTGVSEGYSDLPVAVLDPAGSSPLSAVQAIAAGSDSGYALLSDGTEVAWGYDYWGEIGNGNLGNSQYVVELPQHVVDSSGHPIGNVVSIAAGGYDGYSVLADGALLAFGDNRYYELGQGGPPSGAPGVRTYPQYSDVPLYVVGVNGSGQLTGVKQASGAYTAAYALLQSGAVVAWGDDTYGELGDNGADSGQWDPSPGFVVEEGGSGTLSGLVQAGSSGFGSHAAVIRETPCASTIPTTRVIAQDPNGNAIPMTETSSAQGITTWTGTYSPPVGTPDGQYQIEVCALDAVIPGNCGAASAVPGPGLVTPIVDVKYGVDNVAPTASSSPGPYSDVTSLPNGVSVTWTDPGCSSTPPSGSGVNTTSNPPTLSIDGAPVSNPTILEDGSDCTVVVSAAAISLTPAIHIVTSTASDNSTPPNTASYTSDFDFEQVSDTPTTASFSSETEDLPANASTVSFVGVPVQVDGFTETLTGSARAGYGALDRPVSVDNAVVKFYEVTQQTGATYVGQESGTGTATAAHDLASLAPNGAGLSAQILAMSTSISLSTASVPTGCVTSSKLNATCEAVLQQGSAPVNSTSQMPTGIQTLFGQSLAGMSVPVYGALSVCEEQEPAGTAFCKAGSVPTFWAEIAGTPVPVLQTQPVVDTGTDFTSTPVCASANGGGGCTGTAFSLRNGVLFGCAMAGSGQNLCNLSGAAPNPDGYLSAYLNAWFFTDASGGHPVWQQDHIEAPATGDSCPN
ncbi:MAG: RCC1 domain-containing protein, partial [Acidimicrobiales bacterium]